jgi:hypothetical protein
LRQCSDDISLLIREGYNVKEAQNAARKLFGMDKVSFLAIDGTESQDQTLDILIFYAGAFGYLGQLDFTNMKGCHYSEPSEVAETTSVSAAIPLLEEDAANVTGKATEGGMEVDTARLPSALMHFAEYYMAVKTIQENPEVKVVLLDKTLSGDMAHLVWSVNESLDADRSILIGMETEYGNVSALDLELARILHPNNALHVPAPRSHFIKYAAVHRLITGYADGIRKVSYKELLNEIGANEKRLDKLVNDITKLNQRYSFLHYNDDDGFDKRDRHNDRFTINSDAKNYWKRVFSATNRLAEHIFNAKDGSHPLLYEKGLQLENWEDRKNNNKKREEEKEKRWITADDLDYMTLVMIYGLLRLAWEKKVLVIGLIKDIAASEMIKTVIPILQSTEHLKLKRELPSFSSDKMLLQTGSIVNSQFTKAPWRTFEFDACFRTIVPLSSCSKHTLQQRKKNEARVSGSFKNVISPERMFLKSYIQLWCSENDPTVRSHVFSYDRPCYAEFDMNEEILLHHTDGNVDEQINPIIHFENDSGVSHLVMDILCSMSIEIIPECLGHNYPLFLADKKAKTTLESTKMSYISTVAFEMANNQFNQHALHEYKFREFRARLESSRDVNR